MKKKQRIGDVLVERGVIGSTDLDRALSIQQEKNARLGEVLMQSLHISKTEIATAIEHVQNVAYVECPPPSISPQVLALIPRSVAVRFCVLPLEFRNNTLTVAM